MMKYYNYSHSLSLFRQFIDTVKDHDIDYDPVKMSSTTSVSKSDLPPQWNIYNKVITTWVSKTHRVSKPQSIEKPTAGYGNGAVIFDFMSEKH